MSHAPPNANSLLVICRLVECKIQLLHTPASLSSLSGVRCPLFSQACHKHARESSLKFSGPVIMATAVFWEETPSSPYFYPEDGGSVFLRKLRKCLPGYKSSNVGNGNRIFGMIILTFHISLGLKSIGCQLGQVRALGGGFPHKVNCTEIISKTAYFVQVTTHIY
jgi:hypothetical protein